MSVRYWRAIVEALNFLEPRDLLLVDFVSKEWQYCSRLDEVWNEQLQASTDETDSRSIRDVCREQLTRPHVLAHFDSCTLTLYNLHGETVTTVELPKTFIPTSFGAWVSLPNYILKCGGFSGGYVATSYLIDIHSSAVEELPDMLTKRAGAGLTYASGRVFVFGGGNESEKAGTYRDLSTCEKFTLATKTWSALPDMSSRRRSFTPTLLKDKVYIAGGGCTGSSVDVFCIRSEKFLPPQIVNLRFTDALSVFFPTRKSLIVIGHSTVWLYDIDSGSVVKQVSISRKYSYSSGLPLCYRGGWYCGIRHDGKVWKLDADLVVTYAEFRSLDTLVV